MADRAAIAGGRIAGPRMRTSGKFIAMTGGQAYFVAREADDPDELRKAAREQVKTGADNIKLMATGGVTTAGRDIHAGQLTTEELAAAVEVGRLTGRPVSAHAHGVDEPHIAEIDRVLDLALGEVFWELTESEKAKGETR